jgi:hypothetical protein
LPETRLAFADVPRLLRELVLELLGDERLEACAEDLDADDLHAGVAACGADVLVAGPRAGDPGELCRLLEAFPRMKAVVIVQEGREAFVYELRPSRTLGELSAQLLADTVEAARMHCAERMG